MRVKRQYCLTLNLRDHEGLILEYEKYHQPGNVWPEVIESIHESGITDMQIYRSGKQLIMVMSVVDSFSFEDKSRRDKLNPKVVEWERLMAKFQYTEGETSASAKWQPVINIFNLAKHDLKKED